MRYGGRGEAGEAARQWARWLHSPEHVYVYVPLSPPPAGDDAEMEVETAEAVEVAASGSALAAGRATSSTRLTFRQAASGEAESRDVLPRRPAVWRGGALEELLAGRYRVSRDGVYYDGAASADSGLGAPEGEVAVACRMNIE